MGDIPSLLSLCTKTIATTAIGRGDGFSGLQDVFDLPSDLFECLVMHLPPLGLQKLHEVLCSDELCGSMVKWTDDGRKRGRYANFNRAWQLLFRLRWPDDNRQMPQTSHVRVQESAGTCEYMFNINWQQLYWETHLQNCLDEASEKALLPAFEGCIKEVKISNTIMEFIGCNKDSCNEACEHVKLSYHCQKFGRYARCLRLQNVLCVAGACVSNCL